MTRSLPEKEFATWPVSKLKSHALQAKFFKDVSAIDLQDLKDDIERNGLIEPLEITPQGVVISGHQRLRVLRELGKKEANVLVRHDLVALGPEAVERRLVEANLTRRRLSKLKLIRAYKRIRELEPRRRRNGNGDLRDEIGKRLGLSGRQLDRLLPLVDLPDEIQCAVENKELPAQWALNLVNYPPEIMTEILDAIRSGEEPKKVVALRLVRLGTGPQDPKAFDAFLGRTFRKFIDKGRQLVDYPEQLAEFVGSPQIPHLRKIGELALALSGSRDKPVAKYKQPAKTKVASTPKHPR